MEEGCLKGGNAFVRVWCVGGLIKVERLSDFLMRYQLGTGSRRLLRFALQDYGISVTSNFPFRTSYFIVPTFM